MDKAKPMATPTHPSMKLDKNEEGKTANETRYLGIIDSLMYPTSLKLDICFSVGLCSRFQSNRKNLISSHGSKKIFEVPSLNSNSWTSVS